MKEIELYQLNEVVGGVGVGGAVAGGVAGGVTGGLAGGTIGDANGNSGVGASVGAACGTAVGSAVGAATGNASAAAAAGAAAGAACATGATSGGGGGKVICTELCRNGVIAHDVWMADIRYSRQNFSEQTMRGYHLWGIPYVKLMRKYPSFGKLAEQPTRWFAQDIAYRMGVLSKPNYKGWVLREVFFRPICFGIGLFAKARDWRALWRDGAMPADVRS